MANQPTSDDGHDSIDTDPFITALGTGRFESQFVHAEIGAVAVRVKVHDDDDPLTLEIVAGQDEPRFEMSAHMSPADAADLADDLSHKADDARARDDDA